MLDFLSNFWGSVHNERLFLLACPSPVYVLYLLTYRPRPMQANKKTTLIHPDWEDIPKTW